MVHHVAASLHPVAEKIPLHEEIPEVLHWIEAAEGVRTLVCEGYGVSRMDEHAKRSQAQGQHELAGLWFAELAGLWARHALGGTVDVKFRFSKQRDALSLALQAFKQMIPTNAVRLRQIDIHLKLACQFLDDRGDQIAEAKTLLTFFDLTEMDIDIYARIAQTVFVLGPGERLAPMGCVPTMGCMTSALQTGLVQQQRTRTKAYSN